eukprot:1521710-Rhodomonas_salina.1
MMRNSAFSSPHVACSFHLRRHQITRQRAPVQHDLGQKDGLLHFISQGRIPSRRCQVVERRFRTRHDINSEIPKSNSANGSRDLRHRNARENMFS